VTTPDQPIPPEEPTPPGYGQPPAYPPPPGTGPPPAYPPPEYGQPPAYPPPAYGLPPGYPPPGYGQPPDYSPPPGYPPPSYGPPPGYGPAGFPAASPGDVLVPAPAGGFTTWWVQLWAVFNRDWRGLLPIVLLTYSLPGALFAIIGNWNHRIVRSGGGMSMSWSGHGGGFLLDLLLFWLVAAVLGAIGFAAATRYVTRRSVGATESLGDSLRYGLSRAGRLVPLFLLVGLMVLAGLALCVLPGLYLGVATSLVGAIALYESGPGVIGRSFRMVNANFGPVLGRLAALVALLVALGGIVGCVGGLLTGGGRAGTVISGVVFAVLEAPLTTLLVIGVLLTYTQIRAKTGPTDAPGLDRALDVRTG
jgi:hypothetical protein